jgi:hypothetical protein
VRAAEDVEPRLLFCAAPFELEAQERAAAMLEAHRSFDDGAVERGGPRGSRPRFVASTSSPPP